MADDDNAPAPEEESSAVFKPLVELNEVDTATGEEDESVEYKSRAKLFRFDKDNKQWKERGTGEVKLLKHKENQRIRLLMRRERTFKICMNHYINSSIALRENIGSDRSWVWSAVDYADDERDECVLAIRFPSSANANEFKDAVEVAKTHMSELIKREEAGEAGEAGETGEAAATEGAQERNGVNEEQKQEQNDAQDSEKAPGTGRTEPPSTKTTEQSQTAATKPTEHPETASTRPAEQPETASTEPAEQPETEPSLKTTEEETSAPASAGESA